MSPLRPVASSKLEAIGAEVLIDAVSPLAASGSEASAVPTRFRASTSLDGVGEQTAGYGSDDIGPEDTGPEDTGPEP